MKFRIIFISLTFLLLIYACRENSDSGNNIINPTLGGVYTEIEGSISGTLAFIDAPFLVVGDISVSANDTLKIDAGVALYFEKDTKVNSAGVILAEGTKQKPIIFTSFLTGWLGISIVNQTDTSVFKFCIVREVIQQSDDSLTNGAIEIISSNVIVENCVFTINSCIYGGGLFILNSGAVIKNNIFRGNDAEVYGGAIYLQNSNAEIINNTIYKNTCFNFGGGVVLWDPLATEIQNNIFFNNLSFTGDNRISIVTGDSSNISEQYNYLAFGSMNPMFISNDNLHLSSESPCINEGNPAPGYNDVNGTRNDQGAFGGPLGDW
ncbi:MAG: right-handed parallel beta-helix repeat-containing protein [Ignavibacteriaceae bacterium]